MSAYRGRAGPNFSEFLNNLNTISPSYDQDQFTGDDINLEEDLAMFTNTDFTHFDIPNLSEGGFELESEAKANENIKYEDLLAEPVPFFPNYNTPLQPAPPINSFAPNALPGPSTTLSSTPPPATTTKPSGPSSSKRRADSSAPSSPQFSVEEQARLAAEEDKRRRNTAASARFRVKKKQREQALERTVKDISDKNAALEARVNQLEMENKWLKNLITEKNGSPSKEEFAEAYKQFRRESEERETKSRGDGPAKGVGTTASS